MHKGLHASTVLKSDFRSYYAPISVIEPSASGDCVAGYFPVKAAQKQEAVAEVLEEAADPFRKASDSMKEPDYIEPDK